MMNDITALINFLKLFSLQHTFFLFVSFSIVKNQTSQIHINYLLMNF